jgi:hypothetical protein
LYVHQSYGPYLIGGDFNARIGDLADYIEGVDDLSERTITDYTRNSQGENLVDFLIKSNSCVLNGRCPGVDEYTVINSINMSVVDFAITAHETVTNWTKLDVLNIGAILETCGQTPIGNCKPDHSMILVEIDHWFTGEMIAKPHGQSDSNNKVTYNVTDIPGNFMNNEKAIHWIDQALQTLRDTQKEQ